MDPKKSNKIFLLIGGLGLYLLSTGISFAAFSYLVKPTSSTTQTTTSAPTTDEGKLLVDISGPKTEACPLNGKLYTQAEKDAWSKRRPLTVMIENHEEARPQSGLSRSDVIYEAVAEGGITRFMALFYCEATARETIIGPVRSARTYFLDWASEYGEAPLYAHVGGAHCDLTTGEGCLGGAKADALGQILDYGWEGENDLNQFSIGYPTFWRDYERIGHTVATEHTMYSTSEKLWQVGQERGWNNKDPQGNEWLESFVAWSFKDEADQAKRGTVTKIEFPFWSDYTAFNVSWEYDSQNNEYKRTNGGNVHTDLNTKQQLTTKNIVVQLAKESTANDGYPGNLHLIYGTIGEGKGFLFQDGAAFPIKWKKASRLGRTQLFLESGKEVQFNKGRIWIEVLPIGTEVKY